MKELKEALKSAAIKQSLSPVRELLKDCMELNETGLEEFKGTVDELVLVQAIGVLRKRNIAIGEPQDIENFKSLVNLVKSTKEVEKDDKDLLCGARNTGK